MIFFCELSDNLSGHFSLGIMNVEQFSDLLYDTSTKQAFKANNMEGRHLISQKKIIN